MFIVEQALRKVSPIPGSQESDEEKSILSLLSQRYSHLWNNRKAGFLH